MGEEIRVCHIDTDADFTAATAERLEDEDQRFRVETAIEPSDGLALLAEQDIDCVLSGYDLNGQTGLELLQTLREDYPDLPFLLLTSKGSEEIAGEAIASGVTGYLQKETTREETSVLANRIINAVEKYWVEQELEATARQYKKLVEQNFVGIYIIQNGEFAYVNPKLAEIHGYDRETLIGMSPLELVAPEERDTVRANLQRRVEGDVEDIQYQTVGLTKDGDRIDIELHGSRIQYQGEPAVIGSELDITERKERKRELQRQNERLDRFAGVVSHDLQNPLQVAMSYLELAQAECDSDHLDEVAVAHERMEELITNLLALAQRGDRTSETEPIDLEKMVNSCWQSVETADTELVTDTTQTILADPNQLRQLVENLVRNAVEQDVTTVSIGDIDSGFYVADDGPGIPADEREQIFEMGYSTTDEGTGFGLNIVEEIANTHGWEIHVTGSADGGARFEFTNVDCF